jgi:hypothetical protein
MIRKTFLFLLFFSYHFIVQAQSNDSLETEKTKKEIAINWFAETGGVYSDFQDIKFSDVRYSGIGAVLNLGYNRTKTNKYFMEAALRFLYSKENAHTHDNGGTTILYSAIYFKYLRQLNEHFLLGARVDVFDLNMRIGLNLQNNSAQYLASNNLYAALIYKRPINEHWKFSGSIDLALIGMQKDMPSFAMNYNQKRLENGEIDYQDANLGEPYPYHYWEFSHIFNNLNLKTALNFHYKSRISLAYNWEIRRWATIKSYPTTIGIHSIVFRYNFVHKLK